MNPFRKEDLIYLQSRAVHSMLFIVEFIDTTRSRSFILYSSEWIGGWFMLRASPNFKQLKITTAQTKIHYIAVVWTVYESVYHAATYSTKNDWQMCLPTYQTCTKLKLLC